MTTFLQYLYKYIWIFSLLIVVLSMIFIQNIENIAQQTMMPDSFEDFQFNSSQSNNTIIVVGSGLAGLISSCRILQLGYKVLLIEKNNEIGGNSMKATSGMNGAQTQFQKLQNIEDSFQLFKLDTENSFYSNSTPPISSEKTQSNNLINALVYNSAIVIEYLANEIGVELDNIVQLGGHSRPRSHRPSKGVVGVSIIKGIKSYLETKYNNSISFMFNTTVTQLILNPQQEKIIGLIYQQKNYNNQKISKFINANAIILATGGFANDHSENSLIKEYRPDLTEMPTTNGPWSEGQGMKMVREIGGELIDMEKVQIHPTGFVDPKNPKDATKVLGPEALRGVGGLLLNKNGQRFVDELQLRSLVVKSMNDNQSPFYILLNQEMVDKFGPNFNFYYKVRGFFTKYDDYINLCQYFNWDQNQFKKMIEEYEQSFKFKQQNKDYQDKLGKTIFPTNFQLKNQYFIAEITPVIHYTMGGAKINEYGQVMQKTSGLPIQGLFAAGEVTGGVHGDNRLGGNSLLDCAVFGRICAENAVKYIDQLKRDNANLQNINI